MSAPTPPTSSPGSSAQLPANDSAAPPPPPPPPHFPRTSSCASARGRRRSAPVSVAGSVALYQRPFYHGTQDAAASDSGGPAFPGATPPPPLRITTRRLQVFSYVLAELSSAATLLPDYTRAILNLSRKLIGAWQAVTAAAIARTRYEHALIWAAYHHRQGLHQQHQWQQQRSHVRTGSAASTPSHKTAPVAARAATRSDKRRGARRRSSFSISRSTSTSAAAALFTDAATAAAAAHKRPRLGAKPEKNNEGAEHLTAARVSPSAPSRLPRRTSKVEQQGRGGRASDRAAQPPLLSGAAERRARQLALRQRDQLLLNTVQQLWLDAQEKGDKAGQHVEHLRAVIVNVLFQQYLGVDVEQSYHDLVLYRWLTPVLVSARDVFTFRGTEKRRSSCRRWSHAEAMREVGDGTSSTDHQSTTRSRRKHQQQQQHERQRAAPSTPDDVPLRSLAGDVGGCGGGVRRARRRQAALQVARDIQLLRQVLQRAQITMGDPRVQCTGQRRQHAHDVQHASGCAEEDEAEAMSASPSTSSLLSAAASSGSWTSLKRQRSPSFTPVATPRSRATREERKMPHPSEPHRSAAAGRTTASQRTSVKPPPPPKEVAGGTAPVLSGEDCAAGERRSATTADTNATTHTSDQTRPPPLFSVGPLAVPLPLRLFLQACISFDPTHCAFSLMSRCVVLAHNVRGEEEDHPHRTAAPTTSSSCKRTSPFTAAQARTEGSAAQYSNRFASDKEEGGGVDEAPETFTGLFYLVIARRAVGSCTHTALCFGNHKFIFVRCRDTEALIREVMLDDDDNSDNEEEENQEEEEEGSGWHRSPSRCASSRGGGEVQQQRPAHSSPGFDRDSTELQHSFTPTEDEMEEETGRQTTEPAATPSPVHPAMPARPRPAMASYITTLTARDAHRLQRNASPDSSGARDGDDHRSPTQHSCTDAVPHRHVAPQLRPPLSAAASSSTASTVSPTHVPAAAAAAARRWGQHMRQAARVGQQTSPPPFVSADVFDVHDNPGFAAAVQAPLQLLQTPPAPPPRAMRTAATTVTAATPLQELQAEVQFDASVHSPLHLTPLAFHSRLHANSTGRSRAPPPPPLTLSEATPERGQEATTPGGKGMSMRGKGEEMLMYRDTTRTRSASSGSASAAATPHESQIFTTPSGGTSEDVAEAASETQPQFIITHAVLCSSMRAASEADGGDTNRSSSSSSDTSVHVYEGSSTLSTAAPRASAFPYSLRTAIDAGNWPGGLEDGSGRLESQDAGTRDRFPLTYFEQQVLLPPERGQSAPPAPSWRLPTAALPAVQGVSAEAAAASHFFHMADPLHAAHTVHHGGAGGAAAVGHIEERHHPEKAGEKRMWEGGAPSTAPALRPQRTSARMTQEPLPTPSNPPLSPPCSPAAEPTEGDMAFAAELYARLEFWCLRGQDRSAYLDPSWLRRDSALEDARAAEGRDALSVPKQQQQQQQDEEQEEERSSHIVPSHASVAPLAVPHKQQRGLGAECKGAAAASPTADVKQTSTTPHRHRNGDSNVFSTPTSREGAAEPRDVHSTDVPANGRRGMVRLPLKLLEYTAGTIEVADRAFLADRQHQRSATQEAEAQHTRRQRTAEAGDDEGEASSLSEDNSSSIGGDEAGDTSADFPSLTPHITVNARGKELLFEALHEATELVVCAVRESRAHGGYHDALHQRCPTAESISPSPPPPLTQSTSSPPLSPPLNADVPDVNAGALTPVNSWALTAATAAAQGCSFPIPVGTLSHDERSPFTFDRHQHLGSYGTVRWSQGTAAVKGGIDAGIAASPPHLWCCPPLPANDERQWRCELLKSEFRLARSRALDAVLVDHRHGRPIAALTLEPQSWTEVRDDAEDGGSNANKNTKDTCSPLPCEAGSGTPVRQSGTSPSPSSLFHTAASSEEVVQRTVYVITSFTHYIAPLWRHLRDAKAVLVDMDRTLVDNAVTVHTAAERQRHLCHLDRALTAAESRGGAANPSVLWRPVLRRVSASKFAAPPFRVGFNDALPLPLEELLGDIGGRWSEGDTAACQRHGVRRRHPFHAGSCHAHPTARPSSSHVMAPAEDTKAEELCGGGRGDCGLLQAFLHRTAAQRTALGTLHYEECGAVTYAARPSAAHKIATKPSSASSTGTRRTRTDLSGDAGQPTAPGGVTGERRGGVYSDLVYVRPGVRQFLYRSAVQWNIPVVLVTKSARARTEAIVRDVLDPHRILFPDLQACVVTADEMLAALPPATAEPGEGKRGGDEEGAPKARDSHTTQSLSPLPTSTAERITQCRKSAVRVLQTVLDAVALRSARHAWRSPAWCDLLARLPCPRSVAVIDDAPQVWEERDWPATVNVAPYTLSRVDPTAYFAPEGFMSALLLSCLYGSRCLICSAGETAHTDGNAGVNVPPGERWPHCLCVCPPGHTAAMAGADGLSSDASSFYARDAAASVRAISAGLLSYFSSAPGGGAEPHRMRPPVLLPDIVSRASAAATGLTTVWGQGEGSMLRSAAGSASCLQGRVSPVEDGSTVSASAARSVEDLCHASKPHHHASSALPTDSSASASSSSSVSTSPSASLAPDDPGELRCSPSSSLGASMPATPTSFVGLPPQWSHAANGTHDETNGESVTATRGVADGEQHALADEIESGEASSYLQDVSYAGRGRGRGAVPYEDVEPVQLSRTQRGVEDVSQVGYAQATATSRGAGRSLSSNSEVEDVVPLERVSSNVPLSHAPMAAPPGQLSSSRSTLVAQPVVEDVTCDGQNSAPCTVELRRPERRRVDDPRDAVEDVVPL